MIYGLVLMRMPTKRKPGQAQTEILTAFILKIKIKKCRGGAGDEAIFFVWKYKLTKCRGGAGDEAVQKEVWTSEVSKKNAFNRSNAVHDFVFLKYNFLLF